MLLWAFPMKELQPPMLRLQPGSQCCLEVPPPSHCLAAGVQAHTVPPRHPPPHAQALLCCCHAPDLCLRQILPGKATAPSLLALCCARTFALLIKRSAGLCPTFPGGAFSWMKD